MFVKFVCWLLKNKRLSQDDQMTVTNHLLRSVGSLPLHGVIQVTPNGISIRGKSLEPEQVMLLKESAANLVNSQAWKVINEQALYNAVSLGVHESLTLDKVLFARAAVWFGKQQHDLLELLSGVDNSDSL